LLNKSDSSCPPLTSGPRIRDWDTACIHWCHVTTALHRPRLHGNLTHRYGTRQL